MIELPQTPTLPIHGVMPRFSAVLSLFDGMSCGQIALNKVGIKYENYFASEIDKYAIQVTQKNFPNTIQVGDITKLDITSLPKIDLLIGGSPCQGFSFAGKQLNFDDPRSKLFFDFIKIKNALNPTYFLLENVKMKKEFQHIISEYVGCEPIFICSSNFSAQKRKRLYWTNIPNIVEMKQYNGGLKLKDILSEQVTPDLYLNDVEIKRGIYKHTARRFDNGKTKGRMGNMKFPTPIDEKSKCLNTFRVKGDRTMTHIQDDNGIRLLSCLECERLQTVPDNYTDCVSDTQRYKMLGNGWTVDVIAHIFGSLLNGA